MPDSSPAPKHTPGPWTFEKFSLGSPDAPICHKKIVGPAYGEHGQKNLIAEVHMQHPNHEADGRLLAAAPSMLQALEEILPCISASDFFTQLMMSSGGQIEAAQRQRELVAKAKAAISAAKGAE